MTISQCLMPKPGKSHGRLVANDVIAMRYLSCGRHCRPGSFIPEASRVASCDSKGRRVVPGKEGLSD